MGCAASKVEDLPAVALCRDRCKFLEEALSQTQAMSNAHVAYLASLRTLGPALHRFFDDVNTIQNHCNCNGPPESESEPDSASHLQFPSDSDSETELKGPRKQSDEAPTPVNDDDEYYRNLRGGLASKPPPPPPSPISSTWDLFNFFDAYDRERYPPSPLYSSTHLEHEEAATPAADKIKHNNININNDIGQQEEQQTRPKEKKAEAMRELHLLFDRASESGNQVLKSLQSHHHTISLHQEYGFGNHEGLVMSSQSLSYTLKTLFLWEKKLYDEVKAEERLRVTHEKKSRMLKQLEHNKATAESPKIESVRTALHNVSTKMKIAIHIVDKISVTINKLRDEELWPQIVEFIHRLLGMWKGMVECHKSQYQAIAEASKGLDAIAISNAKLNGAHDLETAIQLKLELQNWNVCFSNWIATQKGYVKALNGWLLRCLLQEPSPQSDEEGDAAVVVPLSPGRLGAPPAFVICNQWSQAMDRLSGKEVIEAIRGFCTRIHLLLMEHHVDAETLLQRMAIENKDVARKLRLVEEGRRRRSKG
ncbi:uncharacterized protein Pyn_08494 [Prunus yedoensis var. nudiflora]|uniref:Nitrate regulatory gene2 protein n=1 Tax=Prunus yedoensis var. nudiflora TaxID=2094558 RepID=A0A314Y1P8_PRUYE|nr:uncharacterized protein Pyn_08494 [Prunus yedoensis var. nudiflora]